jgi:hypothetical protein
MKKLYIHAGFGKCGSSSIQTFLSSQESFRCNNGDELVYAALLPDRIIYGETLVKLARRRSSGYIASLPWVNQKISIDEYFELIGDQLLELLKNQHVILSNEFWEHEFRFWQKIDFFARHPIEVIFIFYIRPPVNWINSAWWQWGAWMESSFEQWLPTALHSVKYLQKIRKFYQLKWISRIRIRLLTPNLLTDFFKILELDNKIHQIPKKLMTNKSLPNGVLRLYQAHRQLRPSPYASNNDFILEKHLDLAGKPDWVLTPKQVEYIIENTCQSHRVLLQLLDKDCRVAFKRDQRYWSAEAFKNMHSKSPSTIKATRTELEQIALAAINSVITLANQQTGAIFDQADIWRDLALHIETTEPQLAFYLMKQAQKLRPNANIINKKLAEYQQKLIDNKIN